MVVGDVVLEVSGALDELVGELDLLLGFLLGVGDCFEAGRQGDDMVGVVLLAEI